MEDMVRVDPNMFITCRLCLEETGVYQITPNLKQQIKFCFDIDIEPYDGLPQLICGNCETILSEYCTKKRIFIGRQNALKAKLEVRKEVEGNLRTSPQQDKANSSLPDESESIPARRTYKSKRRKSRIVSSSSSSSSLPESATSAAHRDRSPSPVKERPQTRKRRKSVKSLTDTWESFFDKRYACKFCNKTIKGNVTNHMKTHEKILAQHKHILTKNISVPVVKFDDQPNITGNPNTVVLRPDKILGKQKENVFIIYIPKGVPLQESSITKPDNQNIETQQSETAVTQQSTDDSDEDDVVGKPKINKRRRLLSTDTVILNDDEKTENKAAKPVVVKQNEAVIECIDLDDSSNGSCESNDVVTRNNASTLVKYKDAEAIKNIVKGCHNKYIKSKHEQCSKQPESNKKRDTLLKHKLLSMGRKIINNEGVNCTGLLRFLEHKNLDVKWVPKNMLSSKDGNYVRIIPRLKGKNELIVDNSNWKPRINKAKNNLTNSSILRNNTETVHENKDESPPGNENTLNLQSTLFSPAEIIPVEKVQEKSLPRLLICEGQVKMDDNKKLLNANPVANPKQLPKKAGKIYGQNDPLANDQEYLETPQEEMVMPIITSFQSLVTDNMNHVSKDENHKVEINKNENVSAAANSDNVEQYVNNNVPVNNNNDIVNAVSSSNGAENKTAPPRLKVKPVSEINSEVTYKSVLTESCNIQPGPANIWTFEVPQMQVGRVYSAAPKEAPIPLALNAHDTEQGQQSGKFVIMNTVELPNTKTESPFRYLQNLLKLHNIELLNSNGGVPQGFNCLIKFKLQLQRTLTVTLCLSVHCKNNMFYLGVSSPSQTGHFDLNKLSWHWQWEILKIYATREDVITKLIINAQKIGPDVEAYIKSFLSLIKSIKIQNCV